MVHFYFAPPKKNEAFGPKMATRARKIVGPNTRVKTRVNRCAFMFSAVMSSNFAPFCFFFLHKMQIAIAGTPQCSELRPGRCVVCKNTKKTSPSAHTKLTMRPALHPSDFRDDVPYLKNRQSKHYSATTKHRQPGLPYSFIRKTQFPIGICTMQIEKHGRYTI
jgi:hypothetical protein